MAGGLVALALIGATVCGLSERLSSVGMLLYIPGPLYYKRYARMSFTTVPCTSVSRKSRPW